MTLKFATNQSQQITWRWEGEAFGNTNDENLGAQVNLRFPGQYIDRETNSHYNHFRYYNPLIGRYNTSDPIGLDGGVNTYLYASSNSLSYIDPDGLWSFSASAYLGYGGGINIAYSDGTLEITGEVGVGLGAGLTIDPVGKPSPHAQDAGSGYIARTTLDAGIGVGAGFLSAGTSFTASSGNAVTTPQGGDYVSASGGVGLGFENRPQFGFQVGASVNVEFGSYSNWNFGNSRNRPCRQ